MLLKHSSISHILSHSEAHTLGSHIQFYCMNVFNVLLHSHRHLSLFNSCFALHFLPSNLQLKPHEICFSNDLDPFIPAVMLNTVTLTSFLSFGTRNLSEKSKINADGSSRALKLTLHLSKLAVNE